MCKIAHGTILPLETTPKSNFELSFLDNDFLSSSRSWPFWYMFQELQRDSSSLLEKCEDTVQNLRRLGQLGMVDPTVENLPGVEVPAIYTFFGQFVDHDITREKGSSFIHLTNPRPIDLDQVPTYIVNSRSPNLDLDHVYGPDVDGELAPRDPGDPNKMLIAAVLPPRTGAVLSSDLDHDFPRDANGSARIGDKRNDENIVTAQLHVAFLRAHNNLVKQGHQFEAARKLLTQHYQWIVLDDFLNRIADPAIVKRIRCIGPKFFNPPPSLFFIPLEFSVAAFRFGHSKVRAGYNHFNETNQSASLGLLFSNSHQRLTADWVIDWKAFLEPEKNLPRPIDTSLTEALLNLRSPLVDDPDPENNLAIRNLLRGYILRMPTGQAVAKAMASEGIKPLTEEQIGNAAKRISQVQYQILYESDFLKNTPLWFYILAEAAYYNRGYHLGPVGSTIVAEVLIGVLRNSTYSILAEPHWRPTLGDNPAKFDIQDLLKLAGVL
jgi:hypothetical protein